MSTGNFSGDMVLVVSILLFFIMFLYAVVIYVFCKKAGGEGTFIQTLYLTNTTIAIIVLFPLLFIIVIFASALINFLANFHINVFQIFYFCLLIFVAMNTFFLSKKILVIHKIKNSNAIIISAIASGLLLLLTYVSVRIINHIMVRV